MNRIPLGTSFLLACAGLALFMASCSTTSDLKPETETQGTVDSDRLRYVQASVEIGCLTRKAMAPQKLAAETQHIYRKHKFPDAQSYLILLDTIGQEKKVQQEIVEGIKNCP